MDDDNADEGIERRPNSRLVRPYLMTGGRTVVDEEIQLDTLLQSTRRGLDAGSPRWESAQILQLAERPICLVELSALLAIPLGAARVLVSDLVKSNALITQRPIATMSHKSGPSLLEQVLDGVRQPVQ